jgi:signal transduction histidine kinase
MKRQRHIRTHVLLAMITLTCGILLAVVLTFNLSIHSYIRSRVSSQLTSVTENASNAWRGGLHGKGLGPDQFDGRPDRVTGTRGSAVVLDDSGQILSAMRGDNETSRELAAYFCGRELRGGIENETVTLESGTYAVSVRQDPDESGRYLLAYVDMTSIAAFSRQVNTVLALIVLAAILLSALLSRRFARALSEPVQSLSDFASGIGGGELETRELRFQDVEFNQLADSMNRMVTELRDAKQKQETFFQNVSHELRTPLTSIRGNAEGIVYGIMEPKTAGRVILSESDKLGGMVEELLYLSRIGRSVPTNTAAPLDLREVLSLCVSEQRAEAEKKGIAFRFDFDDDPVTLPIREQDAQQLFGNLLSNAIRYAKNEILLTCRAEEKEIHISVADDGPGVSEEDLPHVFERFYKGAGGRHGIGLSIAQSVAQGYHGAISVRNDSGAVFEVRFPI